MSASDEIASLYAAYWLTAEVDEPDDEPALDWGPVLTGVVQRRRSTATQSSPQSRLNATAAEPQEEARQ